MTATAIPPTQAQPDQLDLLRQLCRAYARGPHVASVAVVGNAPLEPSEDRAAAVDGCDLVVRTNGFALDTAAGPPTLGRRTDVVTFNRALRASPWFFQDYRDRLYLLVEPGRLHWEPEVQPDWWPTDLGQVNVSNRDVVLPLSAALALDSRTDARWATTGTLTAWLAHVLFPGATLHLTGFSMIDRPGQTSWQHATGDPSPVGAEHLIALEGDLLRGWAADGTAVVHP